MSGSPVGWMPADSMPALIRTANASKSARDSQKSMMPQPPSIGPDAWKISPCGFVALGVDVVVRRVELLLRDARELDADPYRHQLSPSFVGGRV